MAALLYDLAADMERLSEVLEADWVVVPDLENDQIALDLAHDDDAGLASILLAEVLQLHRLSEPEI